MSLGPGWGEVLRELRDSRQVPGRPASIFLSVNMAITLARGCCNVFQICNTAQMPSQMAEW